MSVDVRSLYQYDTSIYHYANPSTSFKHKEPAPELADDDEDFPDAITLNGKKVEFILNDHCKPVITCDDREVSSLAEAVQRLMPNQIIQSSDLTKWAILTNYLTSGLDYQYIDNVDHFKKTYRAGLQKDPYSFSRSYLPPKASMDEICSPHLEGQKLIFYVKKGNVPYRVTTQFGTDEKTPKVYYQVLGNK